MQNKRAGGRAPAAATYAIIFLMLVMFQPLKAQVNRTIYFMDRIPQSSFLNPAHQHDHDYYIGLPMISSLNMNMKSNFASFSDVIFKHSRYDSLITFMHPDADQQNFTSKLRNLNTIAPDMNVGILSFGYRRNTSYFSFNIADRASIRANLPRDLILLGLEGNEQFAGRSADFSRFGGELNYFREYSIGYSRLVGERLSLGVRTKLLFGKANLSFTGTHMNLYTDPESYNITLRSEFNMDFSMPVTLERNENGGIEDIHSNFDREDYSRGNFLFNNRNQGLALDIGATYRLTEPLTLYASITDFGFISWKRDVYNLSMDSHFEYEGLDLSPVFDYRDDSVPSEKLGDTLRGLIDTREERYRSGLPTRIYMGAAWELNSGISLGMLSSSEIYRNSFEQAVTLSAGSDINHWLSASVSYSLMNNHFNNLGMGFSVRRRAFNFYMVSDNILSTIVPHRKRNVNVWLGINLAFGQGDD